MDKQEFYRRLLDVYPRLADEHKDETWWLCEDCNDYHECDLCYCLRCEDIRAVKETWDWIKAYPESAWGSYDPPFPSRGIQGWGKEMAEVILRVETK